MEIDKREVIKLLREKGKTDKAEQAEKQLPDKVDPEKHADLLKQLGVNPQELISKL